MVFNEHVKIREEKFGTVIFQTLSEKVYITNETGKEILNFLQQGKSQEEILTILRDSYDIDTLEVKKDVMEFIAQLKEKSIVN